MRRTLYKRYEAFRFLQTLTDICKKALETNGSLYLTLTPDGTLGVANDQKALAFAAKHSGVVGFLECQVPTLERCAELGFIVKGHCKK
jgi:hypothetical protein